MLSSKRFVMLALAAVSALGFISLALAQDTTPPARGGRGGAGARGNFDPAQVRARMEQGIKDALGATDEEWKVLQPKIEKVTTAQRDARAGGMGMGGMMGGRGGRGARGGNAGGAGGAAPAPAPADNAPPQTPVAKASSDLGKILQDKEAKPEDIKAALTALRDARTKAEAELEKAQKDLKEVVTVKQEAQLVLRGLLK